MPTAAQQRALAGPPARHVPWRAAAARPRSGAAAAPSPRAAPPGRLPPTRQRRARRWGWAASRRSSPRQTAASRLRAGQGRRQGESRPQPGGSQPLCAKAAAHTALPPLIPAAPPRPRRHARRKASCTPAPLTSTASAGSSYDTTRWLSPGSPCLRAAGQRGGGQASIDAACSTGGAAGGQTRPAWAAHCQHRPARRGGAPAGAAAQLQLRPTVEGERCDDDAQAAHRPHLRHRGCRGKQGSATAVQPISAAPARTAPHTAACCLLTFDAYQLQARSNQSHCSSMKRCSAAVACCTASAPSPALPLPLAGRCCCSARTRRSASSKQSGRPRHSLSL